MYDILFDFSSSPAGGGLRRLEAYAEFFSKSTLKTHFFINEGAGNLNRIQNLVPTTLVHKNNILKLGLNKNYLRKFSVNTRWLFSYGIPTKRGYAEQNWLHISNVLPFFLFRARLGFPLLLKTWILQQQFKINCQNNDVVSAESNFSLEMYRGTTGWKGDEIVLRNGLQETLHQSELTKEDFAVAVGTHFYKRIDITYQIFKKLKYELGLNKLIIVGIADHIPGIIRRASDVELKGFIPDNELVDLLKRASYFISTSEVENSSCAVQEGLEFTKKAILSDIPSHLEMIKKNSQCLTQYKGKGYLIVDQTELCQESMVSWSNEIGKMLKQMGFVGKGR
jgi:glycosyltransferase involved in cell wall biosynthesis